ncbi:MAG: NUDIX hydrolase [Dehalococcoidia bacterium]|nr:NUDIX hydrolase [Dehalococcoidia bacterium]
MIEFEILVDGSEFGLEIEASYQSGLRMPSDDVERRWIEETWLQSLQRAESEGVPLYDGRLFRLEGFATAAGRLTLRLGDTGYKEYVATRRPEFHGVHPRQHLANPLAVCAVLVTSDARILVEHRHGLDVYAGRYHVIGGFFERDKDGEAAPDPVRAIQREVREETGLDLDHSRFTCLALVYDRITPHPELCFTAPISLTFDEVRQLQGTDGEVNRLEFIEDSPASLRNFILANHGNISATGEPCLILYGKRRFGRGWHNDLLAAIS